MKIAVMGAGGVGGYYGGLLSQAGHELGVSTPVMRFTYAALEPAYLIARNPKTVPSAP